MNRIFTCKLFIPNVPISILDKKLEINGEYHATFVFECSYQVDQEIDFKQRTKLDITNAIHRNKIEEQLKTFLSNSIKNAFTNHKIGKMTYYQVKECDVDIQDEIHDSIQQFYLIKEGLDILQVEIKEIKLSYQDKQAIENRIKLEQTIHDIFDIDLEMKLRLPEFSNQNKNWTCSCGRINNTKYCPNCGAKKEDELHKIVLKL